MSVDVLSRQVLIAGRITDEITSGRTRAPASVNVFDNATDRRLSQLSVKLLGDGHYAIHGSPETMLGEADTTLRLDFNADGYQPITANEPFTAAELVRITEAIQLGDESVDVELLAGLPRTRDIALQPNPVALKGLVVSADDPSVVIAGASVSVTAPAPVGPVVTDASGYFTLGGAAPLPVSALITIEINAATFQPFSTELRLDFRNPVNQGSFALEPV